MAISVYYINKSIFEEEKFYTNYNLKWEYLFIAQEFATKTRTVYRTLEMI
jgi:hypothetical protein